MIDTSALRFWRYCTRGQPDECWFWQGGQVWNGYGQFRLDNNERIMAHRYAYELERGPIPDMSSLRNRCGARDCVNPWHWEVIVRA